MPHILSKSHSTDPEDTLLKPNGKNDVSIVQAISLFLNVYIGSACYKGGRDMPSGLLFTLICNLLIQLMCFYSTWMILHACGYFKAHNYEGLWKARGFPAVWFVQLEMILPTVGFSSYYLITCNRLFKNIVTTISPNSSKYIYDEYLTSLIIFIIMLPFFFQTDNRLVCFFSWVAHVLTLIGFFIHIYLVIITTKEYGFDPNHNIRIIDFSADWMACITERIATWMNFYYTFFVFNRMKDYTARRSKKVIKFVCLFSALFVQVMQYSTYFIVWNEQIDIIYYHLPQTPLILFAEAALILKLVLMLSCLFAPAIQALHDMATSDEPKLNKFMWVSFGIILFISAVLLSTSTGIYTTLFTGIQNSLVLLMQFLVPALIYYPIVKSPNENKFHWFGVVFFFIIGACLSIYLIISCFASL